MLKVLFDLTLWSQYDEQFGRLDGGELHGKSQDKLTSDLVLTCRQGMFQAPVVLAERTPTENPLHQVVALSSGALQDLITHHLASRSTG